LEDNEPPNTSPRRQEDNDQTLDTIAEEIQEQNGTPQDEDSIADDDNDDGVHSDSSEQSGLCIDYHSDSATEGILYSDVHFMRTLFL